MKKKTFENVDLDLKFNYNGSDWGIVNADANRVKEFILYNNKNKVFPDAFIELIAASMNDALLEDKVDDETRILFSEYICNIEQSEYHLMLIAYWIGIKDKNEFPVGYLIEEILDIES